MCGLAAILAYGATAPPVDPAELLAIREAMRPRGPDGEGLWVAPDGRVGLAHRRLAIIDLSPAGLQPFWSADGRLAASYNGEIYNWRELRRALEQRGQAFRTQCDTEVILALYAAEGPEGLRRLRGMYALALWDGERRGLLLARDPLGIKPLYYADDGATLRVASQVKALLAGGRVATAPDPAGHAGFFLWGHVPEPVTLYAGIRSLPPGGLLWRGLDGRRWERTGSPLPALLAAPPALLAAPPAPPLAGDERARQVRALVGQSLRAHLVADVPVGLFLSAGRDSACLASLLGPAAAATRAFTLGVESFRGGPLDEVPLAAATARACGLAHEVRWVGQADMLAARDQLLAAMDQPSTDGVNVFFIARAAAAAGHRVALSGLGADELFGGYPGFAEVPRLAALPRLPRLGRWLRRLAQPLLSRRLSPKWAGLLEYGGGYPGAYLLRRALFMPWELPRLLGGDLARAGLAALASEATLAASLEGLATPRQRVTALESGHYMVARLLRDADWAGMAHGLEIRTPFADAGLYRDLAPLLAAAAPPGKDDLVAGDPRLPAAVATRRKTGFVVPVERWIAAEGVAERGLRGWARVVYRAAAGPGSLLRET
jgi:asparagine synthase (glutamine-hydrolysing)